MHQATTQLLQRYYDAFNAGDMDAFLSLLTDDVIHDINQGGRDIGKPAFAAFMQRMNRNYRETIVDLSITTNEKGDRAAVEFTVEGQYLATDDGLPEAHGQTYRLPAGAFFEIRDDQVARVTNYYNLEDWIAQVSA
ncbi:ketosteroid isomerase-related protein [Larsenimonas rhizosphaerae]|uniref:Nuclear transport factor 2 family protein n=1 Tax=Larsenimonas rhizosphaerae TaxID=2944682 RepID=A0AA41ZJ05_9GAMM|nr:ketosteroid isomerase-related protein [Larsenimonas rhizosphaerae]MCX2525505.1 nuclear transport factor 2 family protein [Larsenimonas rhizosphaerae]